MKRILPIAALLVLGASPALAHPGHALTDSFAAGVAHPFSGLDHIAVMIAVGLWAALKGGRALWIRPAAFVGVMLVGGALGMAHVAVPFVEPGILASVVVLGAHGGAGGRSAGSTVGAGHYRRLRAAAWPRPWHWKSPENIGGIEYMAGFAVGDPRPCTSWASALRN